MNRLEVIGNLGADAEVKVENGHKFVSLSIADTSVYKKPNGEREEKTMWVSATINGDGGNLLQYLVKGAKVSAIGEMVVRTFHSEKQRALIAGVNLFVRDISLISVNFDEVPRDVYDIDGVAHRISKYYYCETAKNDKLFDRSGREFLCNQDGWVVPISAAPSPDPAGGQAAAEQEPSADTQSSNS